jgi:hypothetical protein
MLRYYIRTRDNFSAGEINGKINNEGMFSELIQANVSVLEELRALKRELRDNL